MKIGMILGNGLNMDLRHHFKPKLDEWDTQKPLQWKRPSEFWSWLGDLFRNTPGETDYKRIENAIRGDNHYMHRYVCNRLLACFAAYQKVIESLSLKSWPWYKWFNRYAKHLDFVVCLNYDLVLETLLKRLNHPYHRVGIQGESVGTKIFKPHGSLDYGFPKGPQMELVDLSEAMKVPLIEMQCSYYEEMPPDRLGESRYSCDVVLPSDYNRIQHYSVISRGYEEVCKLAGELTHVVVLGVSYGGCDRPELDKVLEKVPASAYVAMANPDPDKDWCDRLREQGHSLVERYKPGDNL